MNGFNKALRDYPPRERVKLRWILRHAATNGIIESGAALKFGREWRINEGKLADFLARQTAEQIRRAS